MNENRILTRWANELVARATVAVNVAREKESRGPPTRRAYELVTRAAHAGNGAAGT